MLRDEYLLYKEINKFWVIKKLNKTLLTKYSAEHKQKHNKSRNLAKRKKTNWGLRKSFKQASHKGRAPDHWGGGESLPLK